MSLGHVDTTAPISIIAELALPCPAHCLEAVSPFSPSQQAHVEMALPHAVASGWNSLALKSASDAAPWLIPHLLAICLLELFSHFSSYKGLQF